MRATLRTVLLASAVLSAALAGSARSEPEKCRYAISRASSGFLQSKARALRACKERIVRGKLPAGTDCELESKTAVAVSKASVKLEKRIRNACGGKDRVCGTADDETLASIGWNIASCPALEGATCETTPIASCADISVCVACLGARAVNRTLELAFDSLLPTDPKEEKELHRCQLAIGRATEAYLVARSRLLAQCWAGVKSGRITGPCPDGDQRTLDELAFAIDDVSVALCKACGGADKACDGGDDPAIASIGFPSCPDLGGCDGAVSSVGSMGACLACVGRFEGDCADRGAVPGLASYPEACAPTLNFSLPAVYGSTAITAGFVPDPFTVGITAGGPVNANYLGGGCFGHTTSAPTFSVNYTSGSAALLRFYFIASSADTTMLINTPSANLVCTDDSFGTVNPTVDFNDPSSGRYDVWIAAFASGVSIEGTFYATEIPGNHP